jgi:hypothetical protein
MSYICARSRHVSAIPAIGVVGAPFANLVKGVGQQSLAEVWMVSHCLLCKLKESQ